MERNSVSILTEKLKLVSNKLSSFTISFCGVGAFPALNSPRVVWIGIDEGKGALTELAWELDHTLLDLFPRQHRDKSGIIPHVTLGRAIRNNTSGIAVKGNLGTIRGSTAMKVTNFLLMESILYPTGPVYKPIEKFFLNSHTAEGISPQ